jgi:hypothetical protein
MNTSIKTLVQLSNSQGEDKIATECYTELMEKFNYDLWDNVYYKSLSNAITTKELVFYPTELPENIKSTLKYFNKNNEYDGPSTAEEYIILATLYENREKSNNNTDIAWVDNYISNHDDESYNKIINNALKVWFWSFLIGKMGYMNELEEHNIQLQKLCNKSPMIQNANVSKNKKNNSGNQKLTGLYTKNGILSDEALNAMMSDSKWEFAPSGKNIYSKNKQKNVTNANVNANVNAMLAKMGGKKNVSKKPVVKPKKPVVKPKKC